MHPFLLPALYQMSDVSTSFAGFTLREAQFHIFHIYQENELQLENTTTFRSVPIVL